MLSRARFAQLLWLVLLVRLVSMALLPLMDTTEARYGAIAQMMASSNDWITPWFKQGEPFWGKPPLSFWAQAAAFKILGVNELAARLPSLLATLASLWLSFKLAAQWFNPRTAVLSILIYSTTSLGFVAAGAVMTDPFLTLGTTWALVGFAMSYQHPQWQWRYGLFIGVAIGLLAKGPMSLVLIGGPILLSVAVSRQARATWRALPWLRGIALCAVLSLPWYIAAELKTPGFLYYFLWGEHIMRFIDPGWTGDLYGNGHTQPKGMIWVFLLAATLPWGPYAAYQLLRRLIRAPGSITPLVKQPHIQFLLAWLLVTPAFFSIASNILWTYVLPVIAPFSMLLASYLDQQLDRQQAAQASPRTRYINASALTTPIAIAIASLAISLQPNLVKTERDLIRAAQQQDGATPLIFIDRAPPYSARFYSDERVRQIPLDKLNDLCSAGQEHWLALTHRQFKQLQQDPNFRLEQRFDNDRYILVKAIHQEPAA